MSNEILGLVLLGFMFVAILGGFPISFTLFLLGIVFGYMAMGDRVFHLMTYGIFDTFEGEEGRQANLNGKIPAALAQVGPDLIATDPDIRTIDVLAEK